MYISFSFLFFPSTFFIFYLFIIYLSIIYLSKFSFKFLVVYETQNLKTDKKMTQKKKNANFIMWFEKKKCPFSRFVSFRFSPIPKIENLEILESFHLVQIKNLDFHIFSEKNSMLNSHGVSFSYNLLPSA